MTVFVFGNPDLAQDSLALQILPELQKEFPQTEFIVQDPNEEWEVPEELIIIDSVVGIARVQVFDSLKEFTTSPRLTLHDFDALTNLRYFQKLGKLKKITIVGLPPLMPEKEALAKTKAVLAGLF